MVNIALAQVDVVHESPTAPLTQERCGELLGPLTHGEVGGSGGLNDPHPLRGDNGGTSHTHGQSLEIWQGQGQGEQPDDGAGQHCAEDVGDPASAKLSELFAASGAPRVRACSRVARQSE